MAATPFKGTLILQGARTGNPMQLAISATDVANAFVTFDKSGESSFVLPFTEPYWVKDLILSAAGVDTTQLQVFVDLADINVSLRDASLIASLATRNFQPFALGAGAKLQLKQAA